MINGFIGLVCGFIFGMGVNAYLLQGMPREQLRTNRNLRMRYGALNWGLAVLGGLIAIVISENR